MDEYLLYTNYYSLFYFFPQKLINRSILLVKIETTAFQNEFHRGLMVKKKYVMLHLKQIL